MSINVKVRNNNPQTVVLRDSFGTVRNVQTGNGLTGGPITQFGTISVVANTGIISNSNGLFIDTSFLSDNIHSNASSITTGILTPEVLANSGVLPGTYGNSTSIPIVTVDNKGRILSANTVDISTIDTFSYDSNVGNLSLVTSSETFNVNISTISTMSIDNSLFLKGINVYSWINDSYAWTNTTNSFIINTIAGANAAVGAGANAYATLVGTSANAFASATIASANTYTNETFVKLISPQQTITGNLAVTGSLTVSGNVFSIDTETLLVTDPLIYLAGNNYVSDIVDIGFVANYVNATGQNVHTGIFRDASSKEYYVFQGYDQEPTPNHIDVSGNNFTLAVLNADIKTSNLNLGGQNTILWISSAYDKANAANVLAYNTGIGANAYSNSTFLKLTYPDQEVVGNIIISGTETYIKSNTVLFDDNIIIINKGLRNDPSDIGIVGQYIDSQSLYWDSETISWGSDIAAWGAQNVYSGVFRDATDGIWKIFQSYTPNPDSSFEIDTSNSSFSLAPLQISTLYANSISANGSVGTNGQVLHSDGTNIYWATDDVNYPAGSNTEIQFNDSGSFGANSGLTFNSGLGRLNVGNVGITSETVFFGNSGLSFSNGSSNAVFVSANGNVGIGTTSPSYPLDVVGNIQSSNTVFAVHFDNVSDISLKENISSLNNTIDILNKLNPVSFDWKNSKTKSYGLIAQEVEQILPTIVHSKQDGTKTVNYIEIIAFLIAAVKDLQRQIDDINSK